MTRSESDLPSYEIPDQFVGLNDDDPAPILVREWKRLIHDANWWMQNAVGHKSDADTSRAQRDFARARLEVEQEHTRALSNLIGDVATYIDDSGPDLSHELWTIRNTITQEMARMVTA